MKDAHRLDSIRGHVLSENAEATRKMCIDQVPLERVAFQCAMTRVA